MHTIMVLGAAILQLPLIKRIKERGYRVAVVSPNTDEIGFKYADEAICCDVRDKEMILENANRLNISGIVTDQTDIPVRTVAYVAEKMGLPGIGYETAKLFTDKFLMRERCKEIGVKTLKYQLVNNFEDAIRFYNSINKDVIIKPIDNQGSRGVSRIDSIDKLKIKFDEAIEYSPSKSVLIEEFVVGREFVIEGISYNYEFKNLICGDTHYFNIENVFSATERIFPSDASPEMIQNLLETNKRIITGFGLKQGITHSEYITYDDEIYLIETAARGGGVFISSDLINLSTGICTEDFLIDIAIGNNSSIPVIKDKQKQACCYIAMFLPEGEVIHVDGISQIRNLEYTHRDNLDYIYVGMKTKKYTDKTARYFVIVSGKDRDELRKHINYIKGCIDIRVRTNDGIKAPIWK